LANKKVRLHSAQPLNVAKTVKFIGICFLFLTNLSYPACITLFIRFRGWNSPEALAVLPVYITVVDLHRVWSRSSLDFGAETAQKPLRFYRSTSLW